MAYRCTLQQIVTRAQQRANLEGAAGFIPQPEWADMANQSIADWYDLVRLTTWGGQYYRSKAEITTGPGVDEYPLPGDFLSMISVDWFVAGFTGNQVVSIKPFHEEQRNAFRNWPSGWLLAQPVYYQLWGPNIAFQQPQGVFSVQINYVPTAPRLGNPTQTLDSINGWEEWIVLDVAKKALVKDGQLDILGAIKADLAEQRARIVGAAAQRIQGAAEVVHDVLSNFDTWYN
jgi:hypothetical protein